MAQLPTEQPGRRRRAPRAIAAASALLLVPMAAVPAAAAGHDSINQQRTQAEHKLPKNLKTVGSIGLASKTPRSGKVDVMVQLDAKPAAAAYALGLRQNKATAAAASESQTDVVKAAQNRVVAALSRPSTQGRVLYRTHALYSGVAVRTDASRLDALAALPGVKSVRILTPKAPSTAVTVPLTGAPASWTSTGQTGEGVKIGIIDTGIDYTHADFGGPGTVGAYDSAHADSAKKPTYPDTDKVAGGYDFVGDHYNADPAAGDDYDPVPAPDTNPLDCEGHGSHVSGITAGYGVEANGDTFHGPYDSDTDFAGLQIGPGMAPGATLYALKVFGCEGSTNVVADALDWAADPNGDGNLSDHLDVVNMSLGSDFGSPDDPDSVATNNAALAGISVVASMGNGGDEFEVGGSPGDAVRSIAVAASDDDTDVYDGVAWSIDGADQDPLVGQRSVLYDWANKPGVTDKALVTIGDWSTPPDDSNNSDGCLPFSDDEKAAVTGKVVLLQWDDASFRCGSIGRTANAREAGAVGVVIGDSIHRFSAGINGDTDIPVMQVNLDGQEALLDAMASHSVHVTLTNALRNSIKLVTTGDDDPTDAIASFSSRGTTAGQIAKPDVAAPGVSVFSAAVGTGDEGISESGTSMAAPHTTGLAALVLAKHPGWNPEEVKAAIMGTANHSVYAGPGQNDDEVLGASWAGVGRIDAQAAVATQTLAYNASDPGAVSVSFGQLDVTKKKTLTKKVTVVNKRATGIAQYTVGLDAVDTLPGATWSVSPSAVSLPAGGSATLTVTLTVDPSKLRHDPEATLALDPLGFNSPVFYRDWLSVTSGHVVLQPAGNTSGGPVQVGLFAAPRPVSTMHASASSVVVKGGSANKSGTIDLKGKGVDDGAAAFSTVSGFELAATSGKLPACTATKITDCVPTADWRAADIQYVGASSSVPQVGQDDGLLYFAVTSHGSWRTAAGIVEYDVVLDVDGDGTPDAVIYNTRVDGTDVLLAETVDLETGDVIDDELINDFGGGLDTSKMHGDAMFLPVSVFWLKDYYGDRYSGTVHYEVDSFNGYQSDPVDVVGSGLKLALSTKAPAYQVSQQGITTLATDKPGRHLQVKTKGSALSVDKPKGILLIHHLNGKGNRAEVVKVKTKANAALSLSPKSVSSSERSKAKVTVTVPGQSTTPTGTVQIREGKKVIANGTLSKGKVTITLPKFAAGKHRLVAVYKGSGSVAGDTSGTKTLTVT